jgi:hypothetical protein
MWGLTMKKCSYSVMLFSLLAGWLLWNVCNVPAMAKTDGDLDRFWSFAGKTINGEFRVLLKYGHTYRHYRDAAEFSRMAEHIRKHFLPDGSLRQDNGGAVVQAGFHGVDITVRLARMDEHRTAYLLVTAETSANGEKALKEQKRFLEKKLIALGLNPQANIMIQGELGPRWQAKPEKIWALADGHFRAKPLETYEDEGTVSRTFHAMRLGSSLGNDIPYNLQIALRQDTETGRFRLTAGTPLITGEY